MIWLVCLNMLDVTQQAKAPEPIESFRRVKKYQYEMLGIVYPPKGEKNFLVDFGIVEVRDDNRE